MKHWIKSKICPYIREDMLRGMPIPGEHPNYARAFIRWYPLHQLQVDVLAGIVMTFSIIPDVIAFSTIAKVPATLCLYSTFWLCLVACVFGGQPGLISGTSTVLILIQGNLLRESNGNYDLLSCTLILVGILQCLFGIFKLTSIFHIVSLPTFKGFCTGLALLLFYSQLQGIIVFLLIYHCGNSLGFQEPGTISQGPHNDFLFGNPNSTVFQYFSNQTSQNIGFDDMFALNSLFVKEVSLDLQDQVITLRVNETTSGLYSQEVTQWAHDIGQLLNVSISRISLIAQNYGSVHLLQLRIADYAQDMTYLTGQKLVFAICISLFVLATIQVGMLFVDYFPFSFCSLFIACIAIFESSFQFYANSAAPRSFLLPRVPFMSFQMREIIFVIKYAVIFSIIGLLESIHALEVFDSFDSEEKSQKISANEESEFEMIQYSYNTFSRKFESTSQGRSRPYFGQPHKECIAQGLGNLICGFFGTLGGCVLLEQSNINYKSGSRGRVSALIPSLFILLAVQYFPEEIDSIPNVALIGVVLSFAISRIAWDTLNILRTSFQFKNAFAYTTSANFILVATVAVLYGLEYGLVVGIAIESVSFLFAAKVTLVGKKEKFEIVKQKFMSDYLIVYYFKGPLFFFSSQQFRNNFIFHHNLFDNYSIVFDFTEVLIYDYTSVVSLCDIVARINLQGQHAQFRGLSEKNIAMIRSSGKYELLKSAIEFTAIPVGSHLVRYFEPKRPPKQPLIVELLITVLNNTVKFQRLLGVCRDYSEKYSDDYIDCIQIGQVVPEAVRCEHDGEGAEYSGLDFNYNDVAPSQQKTRASNATSAKFSGHAVDEKDAASHHRPTPHHHLHSPPEQFTTFNIVKWKFIADFDLGELASAEELIGLNSLRIEDQAYLKGWFVYEH